MAIVDQTLVLKGSTLTVSGVGLQPRPDGTIIVGINGVVKDAGGVEHQVSASFSASGQAQIDALMAMAQKLLRQSASLDDSVLDAKIKKI